MFGKLLKHETYAMGRILLPLWGVLVALGVSTAALLAVSERFDVPSFVQVLQVLLMIAFVFAGFACGVVAFVLMISRFRKSVLTDQGYLTNTLPVSVHEIVLSKLLAVFVFFLLTSLAVMLAIALAMAVGFTVAGDIEALKTAAQQAYDFFGDMIFRTTWEQLLRALPWYIASLVLAPLCITLHCYAAMAIGHSFADHKKLLSFVFYFLFSFAVNSLTSEITLRVWRAGSDAFTANVLNNGMLSLGCQLFFAVLYYIITVYFLRHRLNLD